MRISENECLPDVEQTKAGNSERDEKSEERKLPAPTKLVRWLRFNFVGGIGIVVQFTALLLLKNGLHFNYLAATAIAVEAAVAHNFVWHEQFTWADRTKLAPLKSNKGTLPLRHSLARFCRFNLTTGAVSIIGNLALMRVMVGQGHMNYLIANMIAVALCSLANFLVSEAWVFEEVGAIR